MPLRALISVLVLAMLAPQPVTWPQFQTAAAERKLAGKTVVIELAAGGKVTSSLLRVEPETLIVEFRPALGQR